MPDRVDPDLNVGAREPAAARPGRPDRAGDWDAATPGRRVTVTHVAQHAGVALSTASRALTGRPNVRPHTRERVVRSAEALGYVPDPFAQSLRTGKSRTIGFLVADLSNQVFVDSVKGAADVARRHGYSVMLTNSEGDPDLDRQQLTTMLTRRLDGIIVLSADAVLDDERPHRSRRAPLVVFDRDAARGSHLTTVLWDHASGFRAATSSLIARGHRQIGFISGSAELRPVRERLAGFREAHHEAGLEVDESLIRLGSLQPGFGRVETGRLMRSDDPPTALIAAGSRQLVGVLEALQELGVEVGRDVALISTDDVDLTRLYRPPISAVTRDTYRMGQIAAELVIERIEDSGAPIRSVTLPTMFVERGSSSANLAKAERNAD
jgi:LacI family transcriptional regulator